MKKTMTSVLAAAALSSVAAADITGLEIEVVDEPFAISLGVQPYRIYATFDDPMDNVVGVTASDVQSTTAWFQPFGGDDIPPAELIVTLFPETAFDTWVTVGVDLTGTGIVETGEDFEFTDAGCSGSWTNLTPEADNGRPVDGRVLLGQFTCLEFGGISSASMTVAWADGGGRVIETTVRAGGSGTPPPPVGPVNLDLISQVRGLQHTQPGPPCPDGFEAFAPDFEPFVASVLASVYESSIFAEETNVITMSTSLTVGFVVVEDETCNYLPSSEFVLDVELHEAHAYWISGRDSLLGTSFTTIDGPVSFFYPSDPQAVGPQWGVLPPGAYTISNGDFVQEPAENGDAEFELHLATLDHPLDADGSGTIGAADLAALLAVWGACNDCDVDVNNDGFVDAADLAVLLSIWGELSWPFELP